MPLESVCPVLISVGFLLARRLHHYLFIVGYALTFSHVTITTASAFQLVALEATFALSFKSVALWANHTHAIEFVAVFAFYALAFPVFGIAPIASFTPTARLHLTASRASFALALYLVTSLTLVAFASVVEASLAPVRAIFSTLLYNNFSMAMVWCDAYAFLYWSASFATALSYCSVSFVDLKDFLFTYFLASMVMVISSAATTNIDHLLWSVARTVLVAVTVFLSVPGVTSGSAVFMVFNLFNLFRMIGVTRFFFTLHTEFV